ncbi:bacterioferritin [Candidatus Magnetoovum chiemensis]|nr:bacterioferritin [Candidatus Magnetoovum chiemensis]
MKSKDKILEMLNDLLSDELTAISQYMVHSEMCDNWGYSKLHHEVEERAMDEMKHAEKLIARMLFLEGKPTMSELKRMHIGAEVEQQLENDRIAEEGAIAAYQSAIKLAFEQGDHGTRLLLEDILKDEEEHIDWIEMQQDQIKQMGFGNYLSQQMRKAD